jgi:putative ABC transport system permease protein
MTFVGMMLRNLLGRPSRTIFTCLAIAVSVATIISMQSIAHRFKDSTESTLTQRDIDLVVLASGVPDQLTSDLDAKLAEKISLMPGVKSVAPALIELTELKRNQGNISALIQGWPIESGPLPELKLLSGAWLSRQDHNRVMLGRTLAENLKKQPEDFIEIQGQKYTIAGIFQSFVVFENGAIIMPLHELQTMTGREGRVTGFSIVCKGQGDERVKNIAEIRTAIEAIQTRPNRAGGMTALPTREYVDNALPLKISHALAWVVSSISVLVGSFGMLNTMIMSVLERVREIGLLRAVGWPKSRVVRLILGEAVIMSLLGAFLGTIIAFIGNRLVVQLPQVNGFIDGSLTLQAVTLGFSLTVLIGLLGGIYPAYRASRLDPAEALRHE